MGNAIRKFFTAVPDISLEDIRLEPKCIGVGTYGTVYKGQWMGAAVAVKKFETRPNIEASVIEVSQLSKLDHVNIVKLLGKCVQPSTVHIVMEFADGGSVYDILHKIPHARIRSDEVMSWALQAAKGVEYLHSKSIVHQDLRTANLLLFNGNKIAKLCQFGIARKRASSMTYNENVHLMAPEVILDKYSDKTDVYSWGLMLWELLAREVPFTNQQYNTVEHCIVSGKRPSLNHPGVSAFLKDESKGKQLKDLIQMCWNGKIEKRPKMNEVVCKLLIICNSSNIYQKQYLEGLRLSPKPMTEPFPNSIEHDHENTVVPDVALKDIDINPACIGRGAYGTVYKGFWNGSTVAVKKFETKQNIECSEVEIIQLSKLVHPNIVKLIGKCVLSEEVYILLEFADGGSLYNVLHNMPQVDINSETALSWAFQAAKGVAYLHSKTIIHRDLNSANILLFDGMRTAKLCDFGIARRKASTMTAQKGTVRWMAPESVEDKYSEKCDVYSYGMMLWELLTREVPFEDLSTDFIIITRIRAGVRPHLQHPTMSALLQDDGKVKQFQDMIQSCWADNPDIRPRMDQVVLKVSAICKLSYGSETVENNVLQKTSQSSPTLGTEPRHDRPRQLSQSEVSPVSSEGIFIVQNALPKDTAKLLRPILTEICINTVDPRHFGLQLLGLLAIKQHQYDELAGMADVYRSKYLYDIIIKKSAITKCIIALEESANEHIVSLIYNQLQQ